MGLLSVGLAEALSGLLLLLPKPTGSPSLPDSDPSKDPIGQNPISVFASKESNQIVWVPRWVLESLQEGGSLVMWLAMRTFVS